MTPTDLPLLLARARNAEARDDHATYCACWGRIDRVLDRMLTESEQGPQEKQAPEKAPPQKNDPPLKHPLKNNPQ